MYFSIFLKHSWKNVVKLNNQFTWDLLCKKNSHKIRLHQGDFAESNWASSEFPFSKHPWTIVSNTSHSVEFCKKRISRSQMLFKIGVLQNFAIFTGKQLWWSLFLIELQVYQNSCINLFNIVETLLKRDSNTGVYLWELQNFYEHLFLQNTSGGCFWKNFSEKFCKIHFSFLIQLQAKHRCFSVSFGEFSRRASLQNTCEQLLFRFLELKLVFIEIYRNNRSEVLKK